MEDRGWVYYCISADGAWAYVAATVDNDEIS